MTIHLTFTKLENAAPQPIGMNCPRCGQAGTFETSFGNDNTALLDGSTVVIGKRVCPNPKCREIVSLVFKEGNLIDVYPPLRLSFDSEGVPINVQDCLEEAITCHSHGCYRASAIMVRRCLELLCEDRGAAGKNLHQRLETLKTMYVSSGDLIDGVFELKALGNDAAHVEAKDYDNVGESEAGLGIEVVKEILKMIYQQGNLVEKLKALRKT